MEAFRRPNETAIEPSITTAVPSDQNTSVLQSFDSAPASTGIPWVFSPAPGSEDGSQTSVRTSLSSEFPMSNPELYINLMLRNDEAVDDNPQSSTNLPSFIGASNLFETLREKSPFRDVCTGTKHRLGFRNLWELQRLAGVLGLTPRDMLNELRRAGISSADNYDKFWKVCRAISKDKKCQLPEKISSVAWNSASNSFFSNESCQQSVYLSGALKYRPMDADGVFDFELRPFTLDKSCRFHRKFGPSRFMVVSMPSLVSKLPSHLDTQDVRDRLIEEVSQWLASEHHLLGRKWKAFFLEPDKRSRTGIGDPGSNSETAAPGHRIHFFALTGDDIPTDKWMTFDQFISWHIPFHQNLSSTSLKLFQRVHLGLSKTAASIPIDASHFRRLADPKDHAIMNDGCARMSMTLAKAICQSLALREVPSAFQARVGGAKGLWMVVPDPDFDDLGEDGICLEIADSQLKIKPHPKDDCAADKEKRTFDVCDWSRMPKPAYLSTQLLTILEERGVPRHVLAQLLRTDMETQYKELQEVIADGARLRGWVASTGSYPKDPLELNWTKAWPENKAKRAIMLIEHGMDPSSLSILLDLLRELLAADLSRYVDRVQIRVPCSTYLFCIPDPYHVLQPDEVHLKFSDIWKDNVSAFSESYVQGMDVLVARLPARLPSDIQRRKAVWRPELQHFKDVIVFPTTGHTPLADLLSGGDYDGDKPWVCWDPQVVQHFENAELPSLPKKEELLLDKNKKVADFFTEKSDANRRGHRMEKFMAHCFDFNLQKSLLGQCSNEHDALVYHEGNTSKPNAILLAALCSYLVDSTKQGFLLSQDAFDKLRSKVSPVQRAKPAYQSEAAPGKPKWSNINDYLKFWIASEDKERILADFQRRWPSHTTKNRILLRPYDSIVHVLRKHGLTEKDRESFDRVDEQLANIKSHWMGFWGKRDRDRVKMSAKEASHFEDMITELVRLFRQIEAPAICCSCADSPRSQVSTDQAQWPLLRASWVYRKYPNSSLPWHLAANELCQLSAEADPSGCRRVVNSVYCALKSDKKMAEKLCQQDRGMSFEESLAELHA